MQAFENDKEQLQRGEQLAVEIHDLFDKDPSGNTTTKQS